jgi:hypothetical protein
MATQVQFRRGTTSQNNAFTGAQGELTIDTDVYTLRIHDGTTAGGKVVPTLTATQTFTNKTLGTSSVWNGNVIALGYGGTGAALSGVAGAVAYSTGSALALSLAGTSGQVLTSGGTSGPTWVNASSLSTGVATTATTATNIAGGSAGYFPYQSDTNTTAFIAPGSAYSLFMSNGSSSAPTWTTALSNLSSIAISATTDASSITTGVLTVAGGVGISKKLYVGNDLAVAGNTTITGNLTVNGTTTTVNSTTLTVDDKNIELGSVDTPTDITANGGGITLKGATDKTLNWVSSTAAWTSSEHVDIASGKSYYVNGTAVLSSTTLGSGVTSSSLTTVGTIGTGTWQGTIVAGQYGGTGVNNTGKTITLGGNLTTSGAYATTLTATNTTSVTLPTTGTLATLAGAETLTNKTIGAATIAGHLIPDTDITYDLGATGYRFRDLYLSGSTIKLGSATISSTGNAVNLPASSTFTSPVITTSITTPSTTFALVNDTATTVNFAGASTTTAIGSTSSGTTTIGYDANIKHDLTVDGDVQIKGGDLTTNQTTFNVINTTATTVNAFGAATTIGIGANSGTLTIGNPTVVGTQTIQNLYNTTATTVNAFGAATTIGIGASTGTLTVNNSATVFNSTSNIKLPVGDIAARPGSPSAGMVRYNSEISSFEGYASGAWSSLGGVKSVDGLTYILAETSAGASNDELEFYTATDASNTAKQGGWNKTRLLVNTPILVTSQASLSEYPNALIISANGDTTNNEAYIVGVVGEGVASGTDSTQWGVGVYGAGTSKGSTKSAGVIGKGIVYSTSDTGSSVGVRGLATDTHASGLNVGLYSDASGSAVNNYALYMNTGDIFSGAAQTWLLKDNNSAALSLDATGKTGIIKVITTDSAEGVTMSGTLGVTGDFKVNTDKFTVAASSGNTVVAGTLNVTGNTTLTGDLAVNGSDITTTGSGTATVFNTNALTLNMGGAATAVSIGASTGTTTVNNALAVTGDTTLTGDLAVNGGDVTTTATSFNLINATATTLNIGSAASTARLGATSGTLTLGNPTVVGTQTTQNLYNTVATTINLGAAATTINMGSAASGAAVNVGKDLYVAGNLYVTGTQSTGSISTISGSDSAIYTNAGNAGNTREIGLIGTYVVSSTTHYTGLLRDHNDSVYKFYDSTTAPVAGTTQDFAGATYSGIKIGSSIFAGSSSGTTTVQANASASGTLTLPAATDTLIGKATTDILTNKTYDTAGTGNVFKINGTQVSSVTGTGSTAVLSTLPTFGSTGINFSGSSTGTTTLVASATASGSLILPAASDTLVGKATTDTFTNKTFNTADTGNSFSINSNAITGYTGTGATVVLSAAPTITGHPTIEGVTSTGATGSGAFVFATSPSLTTPVLGVASATTINKVTITAPATSATLTIADGKTLTASNSLTFTGTDSSSVAFGAGGTVVYTSNKLSVHASTTSSELAGIISDETGSGSLVFATSPTLVTPTLGVATATSINKMAITAPATGSTLAVADGKTFTVNNTITIAGTDSTTITLPSTTGTVALNNQTHYIGTTSIAINRASASQSLTGITSIDGSAATLTTARAIYGNNFDGSAALTQIIASTYGGTGNGFTKFSGATTSEKTYTLPDATCTILTSNAAVTAAQGGTGIASYTIGDILYASGTTTLSKLAAGTSGYVLASGGAGVAPSWVVGHSGTSGDNQFNSIGIGTAASGTAGMLRATNSITSYYSDERLKTRKGNIQNALAKVMSLDGFHYNANETAVELGYDSSINEVGLSAQQVQAVLPEVVVPAPIDDKYLTIHYERMIPLLVEAIKEQQKQIEELKAKLGN